MTPKLVLVGLVLLTLAGYWPVRHSLFVYEDGEYVRPAQQPLTRAQWLAPRGLAALSYRANFLESRLLPRPWHAVNLGLHLLVGLSLYALARRWLTWKVAALAAGLYLVHPLNTEAVAYVAQRTELIAALGTVGCVWALTAPTLHARHLLVGAGCAVVAVGGKEVGIMALPLAGLTRWWMGSWRWSWRTGLVLGAGGVLIFGLTAGILWARILGNEYLTVTERGPFQYLALQSTALWAYLRLVLVPVGQTVDHDIERVWRGFQMVAIAATAGLGVFAVVHRRRWPLLTLGLAWMLVALLPRFVIRIPEYLREAQIGTPFLGLWITIAATIHLISQELQRRAAAREAAGGVS